MAIFALEMSYQVMCDVNLYDFLAWKLYSSRILLL